MQVNRKGTDLRISIRLALHSLGRLAGAKVERKSIKELEQMLTELRREQIERGILKVRQ